MGILTQIFEKIKEENKKAEQGERGEIKHTPEPPYSYSYGYYRGKREAYDNVLFALKIAAATDYIDEEELSAIFR